jgi:LCP family protein required for cell wall assembly
MRRLAILSAVALLGAGPSPKHTTAPPVFELHRTAQAAHIAPGKTNPLFVLVIGSDVRQGDPAAGRSDSMHIVAVNTAAMRGTVLGIPRDTWVTIPGHGQAKINDSLPAGGPQKVVDTVTAVTGIPIHYWALVDFSRFRDLVDRLGGIDVNVPYKMGDPFSGAFFDPGPRHMNGAEALAFSRNRHGAPGGDIGRSENQGRVLLAGLAKMRAETSDPFGMLKWLEAFRSLVATDVPIRDLLTLGAIARRLDSANLPNVVMPSRTGQVGAASVVFAAPGAGGVFAAVRDDGIL